MQKHEIMMMGSKDLSKVKWTRDDFIWDDNDYDMFLLNPKWKILPTIAFIDGVPRVHTSKICHNGSTDMMIHPSRWHHNLPARQPDQIAHVVVQSRTVRHGKARAYSTEWQMYEQRGHFGGLDTCNHVEFGRFDIRSMLQFEAEDRTIANQYDVNIHLNELCKAEIIS